MSKNIICSIAGIPFSISCDNDEPIQWLKENYDAFISKGRPMLDFYLQYKERIHGPTKVLWEKDSFEIKLNGFCIDGNISKGEVCVQTRHRWAMSELLRSFFSIYLVKIGGFLLHASCILHKGYAYIFCGPSESGKTTIARLADKRPVLTDESVAIIRRSNIYHAFATPFHGEFGKINKNINGRIKAIFFIDKSKLFSHKRISKVDTHLELFRNIQLLGKDIQITEDLFNTFSRLTNTIPCFRLSFRQDPLLWRYIDERIVPILS